MKNRIEATNLAIVVNNGNYKYMIDLKTGSKIRVVPEPPALPDYPETVDLKITNTCFGACPWCHENSIPTATPTDRMRLQELLYTFPGGIEVAIGGGDPVEFPHLAEALHILKRGNNIPSLTVNARTLSLNADKLRPILSDNLIYGLGISVTAPRDIQPELQDILSYKHTVLHVIAGITSHVSLEKMLQKYTELTGRKAKVLILGYKYFGRGGALSETARMNIQNKIQALQVWLSSYFSGEIDSAELISFDTRGVSQLNIERLAGKNFAPHYMGDDGEFSMYINAHEKYASISSASQKTVKMEDTDTLKSLFTKVKTVGQYGGY